MSERFGASTEPRELKRFQQLNAIKISGVASQSVDGALAVLESTAQRILPPGYRLDYTGQSRQLRELSEALEALSVQHPLVLVLEDLVGFVDLGRFF